jgi:PAP2 superfamily
VNAQFNVTAELDDLVLAAQNERADALGEILAQDGEFFSAFMGLLTMTPGSHPKTYRVMHIASQIASFGALYFKGYYDRPRPTHLCPALLPPIQVPGHSSFPSGHSTQAHLMSLCMRYLLTQAAVPQPDFDALTKDLAVLADRIARNRELAGLHFANDSKGGVELANALFATLTDASSGVAKFNEAIGEAKSEWPA